MKKLRVLFLFAAITAAAGSVTAFLALSPLPRLVAALLLLAAAVATAVGLAALRRRRHERLFIRQSIRAYAPYALVAVLLLAGLRMWLILLPPRPTPLIGLPPLEQPARIAADVIRLRACAADARTRLAGWEAAAGAEAHDTFSAALLKDVRVCEEVYDYYKGFSHIDVVSQPQLHAEAFAVGYAAFLQRTAILTELAELAEKPGREGLLSDRALSSACASLAEDATALRLYAGHAYLQEQAESIRYEGVRDLLRENMHLLDRYPDAVEREMRNPVRIFRRYAHAGF